MSHRRLRLRSSTGRRGSRGARAPDRAGAPAAPARRRRSEGRLRARLSQFQHIVKGMAVGYAISRDSRGAEMTSFAVLAGISFSHLLNDTVQALVPAIYPMLKESFALTFAQVGLLTLTL